MNNEQFWNEVQRRNDNFIEGKNNRQTKIGVLVEDVLVEVLNELDVVTRVERAVINPVVDQFFNVDVRVTLRNGVQVYIPVVRDMWRSTAQNDRLASTYYKCKFNTFGTEKVLFFFGEVISEFIATAKRNTWKQNQIVNAIEELYEKGHVVNVEELVSQLVQLA